jgi:ribosomal protein S14
MNGPVGNKERPQEGNSERPQEGKMTEPFKLNFAPAQYGGVLQAVFYDLDGYQCRMREVSGADASVILGLVGPRDFGVMHLSREQARELGRALTGFAETGKLGESGEDSLQILQAEEEAYQVCSKCGRKTWARREFNNICRMTQPDGEKCAGRFQ